MTCDLEILKELFLPPLEELASFSSGLANGMSRGEIFWAGFNNALLGTSGPLRHILTDYQIKDAGQYAAEFESLKAEYIACLAQHYCAGKTSPAITLLLENAEAAFTEEIAFQKDLRAAVVQAGRAAIRNELELANEFAGVEISDEEISGAFASLHSDAERIELRNLLQQSGEEEPAATKPRKRKRVGTIALLFLKFAAAAAVGTVVTVEAVKVYNDTKTKETQAVKDRHNTDSNKLAAHPAATDTSIKADTLPPNIGAISAKADTAKAIAAHPYIVLRGTTLDTASKELVGDVTITMTDDKGKTQTLYSKDGRFRFRLPLYHDFVISGKKEGYHSARLSLSTKDAREADAGEVIKGILRFTKDPRKIKSEN